MNYILTIISIGDLRIEYEGEGEEEAKEEERDERPPRSQHHP